MNRQAIIERTTKETAIRLELALDQAEPRHFSLGLPFFEHMLNAMSFHGGFGLRVEGRGDVEVDPHHLVEDVGLVLGQALAQALGSEPVARYGSAVIPMDDALSEAVIDLCQRPYFVYRVDFPNDKSGTFDMSLFREFFQAFANKAAINLHLDCRYGHNAHHMVEALFKALGKALAMATRPAGARVQSTKGSL